MPKWSRIPLTKLPPNLADLTEEDLREYVASLSDEELASANASARRIGDRPPTTNSELWDWIHGNLGLRIPKDPVCPGHDAPFDVIADLYFERLKSVLIMANRGGGKTFGVALVWYLNSVFRPGVEMCTVGAIEEQAIRCFAHLKELIRMRGGHAAAEESEEIEGMTKRSLRFVNRCLFYVLPGTKSSVNGPHPNKNHFDEVELAKPDVYQESRNMAMSKGDIMKQDIVTSTRKTNHGKMQELIDEYEKAVAEGFKPPYEFRSWCIFETAERVDNCQAANPELPRDKCCDCHLVRKGKWEDGSDRTFNQVCRGRLARSNGYLPLDDVHQIFMHDSQSVWEAQIECEKPHVDRLVWSRLRRRRHSVREFDPDPMNGQIFATVDFGGSAPNAVSWWQKLARPAPARNWENEEITLPPGALVCFDHIYETNITNERLAMMVRAREELWREGGVGPDGFYRNPHPQFKHKEFYADIAAKPGRMTFAAAGYTTIFRNASRARDIKEQIKLVNGLIYDDLLYCDVERCGIWWDEAEYYHYPDPKAGMVDDPDIPVDDFNHHMSAMRYLVMQLWYAEQTGQFHPQGAPEVSGGSRDTIEEIQSLRASSPISVGPRRYESGDPRARVRTN